MNNTEPNIFNELPVDNEVVARARTWFGEANAHVDAHRVRQLRQARQRALEARPRRRRPRAWVPVAGGAAACCALAIGAMWMHPALFTGSSQQGVAPVPAAGPATDATSMPDVDSNQMDIAQDLDFYRWLASQPASATGNRSRH